MAAPISPALFDQFARGWRGYVLVALIALASALFGAGAMPPLDLDESQFALATRQVLETGAPPAEAVVAHSIQALAVRYTPGARADAIWAYRLPSAFGLMLAALAALWAGKALIGERGALIGAGLLAAGLFAGFEAMCATPVALLLGPTTLSFAALARMYPRDARNKHTAASVFWIGFACAFCIDAILTPLLVGLAIAVLYFWEQRLAWLRPLLWWPAIGFGAFIVGLNLAAGVPLGTTVHLLTRHLQLPGFHTLLLPLLIFPATYALPAALRLTIEAMRAPQSNAAPFRFLIAWASAVFFFAELWPTKLPTYALPAYPAIALMCGAGMAAMLGRRWRSAHPAGLVLFAVAGLVLIALLAASATFMPGDLGADVRRAVSAGLIGVLVIGGAIAGLLLWRRSTTRGAALIAAALALSYSIREHILPDAREFNVSSEVVAELRRNRLLPHDGETLWVVGYPQASIVLMTNLSTRLAGADQTAAEARESDTLVVESRQLERLHAALDSRGLVFEGAGDPIRGIALDNGRRVALSVGHITASADAQPQNPATPPTRRSQAPR